MGNKKASVLPEPVSDNNTVSLFMLIASMDASCMSFKDLIFKLERVSSIENKVVDMLQKYENLAH